MPAQSSSRSSSTCPVLATPRSGTTRFVHHLDPGAGSVHGVCVKQVARCGSSSPPCPRERQTAEIPRQLGNEELAYHELSRVGGRMVPRLYGEYEWYGGRALVLSEEGKFTSLSLTERHGLPVRGGVLLEPQDVLQKRGSHIVDFGFSDVDRACPGWRECGELNEVRRRLQLDRVNFGLKGMVSELNGGTVARSP
ncbi:hypothetical protein F5148DRAFT_1150280 [Russula earlei]|uniref:Uncharacterized protein n=1 Tax=Russula earlei TaxID=71964 RepID=A0ACC0U5P0_9AGAM|nr:hypothetical protein F5148DRAFT_1150280 [Russula earlei]